MKFDSEKKQAIVRYLLEKVESGSESVNRIVAEQFQISTNTVNSYIKELVEQNVITKLKRGCYKLVETKHQFCLSRSKGDLDSDTYAYEICLRPLISNYAPNVQAIWNYVFSEMTNNVMDHSEAENLIIGIKQNYLNTTAFILDDGIGIFEKVKNHFNYPSIDETICELFKGKLTTDSENHSGEGIFFSSKMVDRFFILSSGKVFTNNKFEMSNTLDVPSFAKGTLVYMSLSNHTNKTPSEVFNMYSNIDDGFTRTRIPLKNIFDAYPVSRSQAKRVCNRLEKFKEVTLDFDGVDWIGQGFAHQLFVIFRREHSEIQLIIENMNEEVKKIYNHVMNT